MATEQAQELPLATITRRQQPTDAYAASLPTEMLAQILAASLERLDAWSRESPKMCFARVCVSWYGAAEIGRELAVKDTKLAERRAKLLTRGSVEQRDKVRSLTINIEEYGVGRGQRVAQLVRACPQLETLQLLGIGPKLGTWASGLGTPLTEALKTLTKIRTFEIDSSDPIGLAGTDLLSFLSKWPNLTALLLPNFHVSDHALDPAPTLNAATTSLHELHFPLRWARGSAALDALLKSGKTTLRHLDFGAPSTTAEELAKIPAVTISALEAVAPRLLSFEAVFVFGSVWRHRIAYAPSTFLESTLAALRDVEEVAVGDLGYSVSRILPLLQSLPNLQVLSIGQSKVGAAQGPFDQLTPQAAIDFLDNAEALEYLSLPRQLEEIWTKDELNRVTDAAEEINVRFELG